VVAEALVDVREEADHAGGGLGAHRLGPPGRVLGPQLVQIQHDELGSQLARRLLGAAGHDLGSQGGLEPDPRLQVGAHEQDLGLVGNDSALLQG